MAVNRKEEGNLEEIDEILNLIESLRQKMHSIADEKGISDPEVLSVSKILDEALNRYQNQISKRNM